MGERGSVLPAILALAFGGLLLLGVAMDLTMWASSHREVAFAADAGAQAGAAAVSEEALRDGQLAIEETAARASAIEAATSSRPRMDRNVTVFVGADQVCVVVEQPFSSGVLAVLSMGSGSVRGSACAIPSRG